MAESRLTFKNTVFRMVLFVGVLAFLFGIFMIVLGLFVAYPNAVSLPANVSQGITDMMAKIQGVSPVEFAFSFSDPTFLLIALIPSISGLGIVSTLWTYAHKNKQNKRSRRDRD